MNVAVLGASNKPERYSFQAVKLLAEKGHAVFPVHPALAAIDGVPVFKQLGDIPVPLHTLTVCVGSERSTALAAAILAARPQRVIFNPGAEGITLGCTKLGLLIHAEDSRVPLFDTTRVHALAAVEQALK